MAQFSHLQAYLMPCGRTQCRAAHVASAVSFMLDTYAAVSFILGWLAEVNEVNASSFGIDFRSLKGPFRSRIRVWIWWTLVLSQSTPYHCDLTLIPTFFGLSTGRTLLEAMLHCWR